jgi:tetratricopeptide (TPR) repeat protein
VTQLREALALSPAFPEAQLLLARTLRGPREGSAEALAILQSVLDANPRHALARFEKAVTLESLGRQEEALEEYQAAAQLAPSLLDARRALVGSAFRSEDWCAAAAGSRAVLAWEPDDSHAQETLQHALQKIAAGARACPSP